MTSFAFILGVVPMVVAEGAGAEMRRSLGTAVFCGMFGVTLFGIFLTPVFFYVIEGLGESRLFASATVRWYGSLLVGAAGGLGAGIPALEGRLRQPHCVSLRRRHAGHPRGLRGPAFEAASEIA